MPHGIRSTQHVALNQVFCLPDFSGKDMPANLRQCIFQPRVVPLHGLPVPQTVLIELDALHPGMTVHHSSEASVAQRQCIRPRIRSMGIPHGFFFHVPVPRIFR